MLLSVIVLAIEGLIKLGQSAEFFQAAFQNLLRQSSLIVVDLENLDYLDSTGVGELVAILIGNSQRLVLSNVPERVARLLEVSRQAKLVRVFETEDEAVVAVAQHAMWAERGGVGQASEAVEHEHLAAPDEPSTSKRARVRSARAVPDAVTNQSTLERAARRLHVFLCHASDDKERVRVVARQLAEYSVEVWFDEDKLLPGQDWSFEIQRALRSVDAVAVCLSAAAVSKAGYVQKEINEVLAVADEQPEGTIFVIPAKLEPCDVPRRLARWQWVDLSAATGLGTLIRALDVRAAHVGATRLLPQ